MGEPVTPSVPEAGGRLYPTWSTTVDETPATIPPLAPTEYKVGDKVLHTDSNGVVSGGTIRKVNPRDKDGTRYYDITFDNSNRRSYGDDTPASRLQPRDDPGVKSNRIEVDLPKSTGVPAGTYRYATSKPVDGSHLWEMYYVNTVYDDVVIALLVDHNPMCPAKRTWPLTVSRCYLRR